MSGSVVKNRVVSAVATPSTLCAFFPNTFWFVFDPPQDLCFNVYLQKLNASSLQKVKIFFSDRIFFFNEPSSPLRFLESQAAHQSVRVSFYSVLLINIPSCSFILRFGGSQLSHFISTHFPSFPSLVSLISRR